MLVNFRFKNARSFYKESTLSMEATKDKTLKEFNSFTPNDNRPLSSKSDLLKSVLIFGPNASGKSNILNNLYFMRYFVLNSSASSFIRAVDSLNPFAFYKVAESEESLYEVEIVSNGRFYKYGFMIKEKKVISEWLSSMEERTKYLFKREGNHVFINKDNSRKIDFLEVNDTTLFLSIGLTFNSPVKESILDVITWFQKLSIITSENGNALSLYKENKEYLQIALNLLLRADFGIKDLDVRDLNREEKIDMNQILFHTLNSLGKSQTLREDIREEDVITSYDIYDNSKTHNIVGQKNVPLYNSPSFNSKGTEKLLTYLGYIIDTLNKGGVILIDDLDAFLSPTLTEYLVNMFNSIDRNPNNAQLIASVQNAALMDKDLRRDEIYFVSKDNDGASFLCSLSDFKDVRKSDNYSKKYLAGFYTKLPYLPRGI